MGFVFIPMHIHYLGVESFGLIGIFAMLQAWFVLLDMGLSQTLNREMARFRGGAHTNKSIIDLLRSMEIIYLCVAAFIAISVFYGSQWISLNWLKLEKLNSVEVADAIAIMGGIIALRWLGGLYRSAISGLQEQVLLNVSGSIFSTLRGLGVIGVLAWISPTIQVFFVYQGLVSLLETLVLGIMLYILMPRSFAPGQFSWAELSRTLHFSSGVMLLALLGLLMTQTDKFFLSKWFSLTEFGYYSLAGVASSIVYMFVNPIGASISPRLAEMVVKGDAVSIKRAYHRYAQFLTMTVAPVALVVAAFSDHLLILWTHDLHMSLVVAPIVSVLCIGTLLNALMSVPYFLQLAYGWTRLTILTSLAGVVIYIPLLFLMVPRFGLIGAAWLWVGINMFFIVVVLPIMHDKIMPDELSVWYRQDVLPALITSGVIVTIGRSLITKPESSSFLYSFTFVFCFAIAALSASIAVTPIGRELFLSIKNHSLRLIGMR